MPENQIVATDERNSLLHAVRTTVAAVASQLVAQALRMPDAYWATVTTIVVMQSSLGQLGQFPKNASRARLWAP